MVELVLAALAVFAVWEYLLALSPWQIHPALQFPIVVGLGYLALLVDHTWLLPVSVAGGVALLHVVTRPDTPVQALTLPRSGRRSEVGSRIPGLP